MGSACCGAGRHGGGVCAVVTAYERYEVWSEMDERGSEREGEALEAGG